MLKSHSHWDSSSLWSDRSYLLGTRLQKFSAVSNLGPQLSESLLVLVVRRSPVSLSSLTSFRTACVASAWDEAISLSARELTIASEACSSRDEGIISLPG